MWNKSLDLKYINICFYTMLYLISLLRSFRGYIELKTLNKNELKKASQVKQALK